MDRGGGPDGRESGAGRVDRRTAAQVSQTAFA